LGEIGAHNERARVTALVEVLRQGRERGSHHAAGPRIRGGLMLLRLAADLKGAQKCIRSEPHDLLVLDDEKRCGKRAGGGKRLGCPRIGTRIPFDEAAAASAARRRSRSSMHPYCLIHQRTTQASHTAAVTTRMTANP
jgi:hypothetical protein